MTLDLPPPKVVQLESGHLLKKWYTKWGQVKKESLIKDSLPVAGEMVKWDGKDENVLLAKAGIYLFRIETEDGIINGTVVPAR